MAANDRRRERARLAAALRDRREDLGLSRREVADRSGLSYPYVSQLENGDREPSLAALEKLATAFATPVEDLLKQTGSLKSTVEPVAGAGLSAPSEWHLNPDYPSAKPAAGGRSRGRRVDLDLALEDAYAALLPLAPEDRLDAAGALLARCLRDSGGRP